MRKSTCSKAWMFMCLCARLGLFWTVTIWLWDSCCTLAAISRVCGGVSAHRLDAFPQKSLTAFCIPVCMNESGMRASQSAQSLSVSLCAAHCFHSNIHTQSTHLMWWYHIWSSTTVYFFFTVTDEISSENFSSCALTCTVCLCLSVKVDLIQIIYFHHYFNMCVSKWMTPKHPVWMIKHLTVSAADLEWHGRNVTQQSFCVQTQRSGECVSNSAFRGNLHFLMASGWGVGR